MPGKRASLANRFWSKVDRSGGPDSCWPWTAAKIPRGYGVIGDGRTPGGASAYVYAHRLSWSIAEGRAVPKGLCILHSCDNPSCVNPAHLSLGSVAKNARDRSVRGRGHTGRRPYGTSRSCGKLPRFRAEVRRDGTYYHLGTYPTVQQANFAAIEFRIRYDLSLLADVEATRRLAAWAGVMP